MRKWLRAGRFAYNTINNNVLRGFTGVLRAFRVLRTFLYGSAVVEPQCAEGARSVSAGEYYNDGRN
jgi:hypothetical protein